MRILVAVTGASGFPLATALLRNLQGHDIHLIVSDSAWKVLEHEGGKGTREDVTALAGTVHDLNDITSAVCSGSYPLDAMVVIPCSMNTLAHIANGIEHNAITRAAGVNLKQERKVILVPRETPLSLPHLRNMVLAKEAGCSIVPPMLSFYNSPGTVEDCTNFVIGKVLELLGIGHDLYRRWN